MLYAYVFDYVQIVPTRYLKHPLSTIITLIKSIEPTFKRVKFFYTFWIGMKLKVKKISNFICIYLSQINYIDIIFIIKLGV